MGQGTVKQTYHDCREVHKLECKWSLPDFKDLATKDVGYEAESQSIDFDVQSKSDKFYLILYPHGFSDRVKDYISIWLRRTSTDEKLIQFTCTLRDARDKEIHKKSIKQMMSKESHLGWSAFCRRDFILGDENEILRNGNLNLNCTLEIFKEEAIPNPEIENDDPNMIRSLSELSMNLNNLLLESTFYDVTLLVEGDALKAHKAILSARSPVFKSMMKSPLQANTKQVIITDINNKIMKEMLYFMYSGKVHHLNAQTAMQLYYASDKYEVLSLKNICAIILKGNFHTSNAIDILVLAYRHSDTDLICASINFIAKNFIEIQERTEWKTFVKHYTDFAIEVVKHITKKKSDDHFYTLTKSLIPLVGKILF